MIGIQHSLDIYSNIPNIFTLDIDLHNYHV